MDGCQTLLFTIELTHLPNSILLFAIWLMNQTLVLFLSEESSHFQSELGVPNKLKCLISLLLIAFFFYGRDQNIGCRLSTAVHLC